MDADRQRVGLRTIGRRLGRRRSAPDREPEPEFEWFDGPPALDGGTPSSESAAAGEPPAPTSEPIEVLAPGPEPVEPAFALTGQDLVRRYGEGDAAVEALRGVSVSFDANSFTAIMGPSGSGKSTLMHILAGLDRPTSGEVHIGGQSLADLDDRHLTLLRRRSVGFVFQAFHLLPALSVEENVVLPLTIAAERPEPDWVDTLLDTVGLADRRSHRPAQLSGGQRQRVALARALVTRPAIVFADEPTGNLDSTASEEVLDLMRRAVDHLHQTVVLVTHDAAAAARADRVLFLADGHLVRDSERLGIDAILDVLKET